MDFYKVVHSEDKVKFEAELNELFKQGYQIRAYNFQARISRNGFIQYFALMEKLAAGSKPTKK